MKKQNYKTRPNLESFQKYADLLVADALAQDGPISPTFLCFGRDRSVTPIRPQLTDHDAERQFAEYFRLHCVAEDAVAVLFLAEVRVGTLATFNPASQQHGPHDLRKAIVVSIELPDDQGEFRLYPVIGEHAGGLRLGQCQTCSRHHVQGPYSKFLPVATPTESDRLIAAAVLQRKGRLIYPNTSQRN